jgi:hypothetical protein
MFAAATAAFSDESITATSATVLTGIADRTLDLVGVLDQLGIITSDAARAEVAALPRGIRGALLGLLFENFQRTPPFQIQFAWEPSYEYKLTVHEAFATDISTGGITVVLGTRYPGDPSPARGPASG